MKNDLRKRVMKLTSKALALSVLLLGFVGYASADTTWTLDATFTDGLTANGSFVTDSSLDFLSWDVTFAGGTLAHDFVDSSSSLPPGAIGVQTPGFPAFTGQVQVLYFANQPGFDPYVDFYLGDLLTPAGGSISLVGGYSCDGTCYLLDSTATNTLVGTSSASPVPEPTSLLLMGSGLLGLAKMRMKKKA